MSPSQRENPYRAEIIFTTVRNKAVEAVMHEISGRWKGPGAISRIFTRWASRGSGNKIVYAAGCDTTKESKGGCLFALAQDQRSALSPFQYTVEPCANCPRAARVRQQTGIIDDIRNLVSGG